MTWSAPPARVLAITLALLAVTFVAAGPAVATEARGGPHDGVAQPRKSGHFDQTLGAFQGRYVSFTWDAGNCSVINYGLYGVVWFERIHLSGVCQAQPSTLGGGAKIELGSDEVELDFHDAPNGLLRVASEGSVRFKFARGVDVAQPDAGFNLTSGTISARLWSPDGDELRWTAGLAILADGRTQLVTHPLSGLTPERQAIRDAVTSGRLGAEVDVLPDGIETLVYDDLTLRVHPRSGGSYRFVLDANLTEGRAILANFPAGAFDEETLKLRYFDVDEENLLLEVPITPASDLADALDTVQGEGPEYWAFGDAAGFHVVVSVPEFSVHAFDLASVPPQVVPIIAYGVLFGIVFIALAAIGLFVGRHRRR